MLIEDTLGTKTIDLEQIAPYSTYQFVEKPEKFDNYNFTYRGVVSFSRIAFNKNHSKALFRFDFNCNFDCGWGAFILTEKINGQWKVLKKYTLWVN